MAIFFDPCAKIFTIETKNTAYQMKIDKYGYLLHLLTVLPEWGVSPTDKQIKSVMPWSMALPPYCKQTYSEIQ